MQSKAFRQNSKTQSSEGLKKEDLYDHLLSSLGADNDSLNRIDFEEWKRGAPEWEREMISQTLILELRLLEKEELGNLGPPESVSPLILKILSRVVGALNGLSPAEMEKVDVRQEFQKVIVSSRNLPEGTKETLLECLKMPLGPDENHFRRVLGLKGI